MNYNVHIKPYGYNFNVKENETILNAAFRQGFIFPHDCESGICGTCKGKLFEGQVEYEDALLPALSENEREAGIALFCAAKPLTDLVIQIEGISGPSHQPLKKLTYTVKSLEQLTETIYQAVLQPPKHDFINYHAGQYVEILHRDASPHPFSIANAPNTNEIELYIRYQPDNPFTAELLLEMRTHHTLLLQGPFGQCHLRSEPPYPIILLAGGTGIAPYKALIEQAIATQNSRPIYLYWGARTIRDLYLNKYFQDLEKQYSWFHFIPVLSNTAEKGSWTGRIGLVHEAVVQDHPELTQYHVYASGPPEMVYAAFHEFKARGLTRSFMYSDTFDYPSL